MKNLVLILLFIPFLGGIDMLSQNKFPLNAKPTNEEWKLLNSDSLLTKYSKEKKRDLMVGDTLKAIKSTYKVARIHAANGFYPKAYDGYWEALIYSNKVGDSTYLNYIYSNLAVLYSVFRNTEEAEKNFNTALSLIKKIKGKSLAKRRNSLLYNNYYRLITHHRENGNYGVAKKYIDTCNTILNSPNYSSILAPNFIKAETAYILSKEKKYNKALEILLEVEPLFIAEIPSYLVIFYSFLGDVYYQKGDFRKSEESYLNSLKYSKIYKVHQSYVPDVYQSLGNLYVRMGKMEEAYENLQNSKDLIEDMFGMRSKHNRDILELKDAFRLTQERQVKKLEEAKVIDLKQQRKILFLRNTILSISFVFSLVVLGAIAWYFYKKRTSEKEYFLQQQQLNREKNAEVLALKNRELTSSALQLIDKDTLILEIKEKLNNLEGSDKKEINQMLSKIKVNKANDWKEFNARFTSVNKQFYETLSERFPNLTKRDHRLCALIKLNFSSKEISQLIGISLDSVNTSRYRLRKKMGLQTSDNLAEFISRL